MENKSMTATSLNIQRLVSFLILMSVSVHVISAIVPGDSRTRIFPVPQQLEVTEDALVLDESVAIILPLNPDGKDLYLARSLVRELSDKYGVAVKIESRDNIPSNRKSVVMGTFENPLVKKYCRDKNLHISAEDPGPEGYLLHVKKNLVLIAGSDDAGAFFGLQSLRQLIADNNGTRVQGVRIKDWPNLPFRGIRLYVPGPENIAFFKRFLSDFMALYKFNKVIIELNCMRLDRHPEVNAGWIEFSKELWYSRSNSTQGLRGEEKNSSHYDAGDGFIIEKNDVKDIVDLANQNFIEVIPEIPSLTHGYYLLTRHPELAEYSGDTWPDTYCPSNPASYDLMFDVYDEYIDVIHPKMIHIGHDEWRMPLDSCPACYGKDYSTLFAGDINKIHDYMDGKGIKIAMWGDHLLESVRNAGPREGKTSTGLPYRKPGGLRPSVVRDSIPKDILIFNWFWLDEQRDHELNDFGFKQIYGNFKPNINNWDNRIKDINLAGGAPSSWASTNQFNFGKDLILDFLGCANLLWSKHTLDQLQLAAMVRELMPAVRANLSAERIPSEDGDPVEVVDISSHFNLDINSKVFGVDLSTLKPGEVFSRKKIFRLMNNTSDSENCAVAVGAVGTGENPLPENINGLEINEDVSSLIFLHACALPAGNQKAYYNIPDFFDTADLLGWYEIIYEDGYKINVPIQYGVNILEWNPGGDKSLDKREGETGSPQNAYCYLGDPVLCSRNKTDNPVTFFAYEWVNPRFGKKIKEVNVFGSQNYQAQQRDYLTVVSAPMPSNAIFLAGISKVLKRKAFKP
jgi:hypothetical protein